MGRSGKICRHLHLPVQSGSSRILQKMNRRYTKEQYLALVEKIRAAVPDISLTTDIIVGFPGETEEDMYRTISRLDRMDIQGIKLQLLHILKGTDLADYYAAHPFYIPRMEDYFRVLGNCVSLLRPDIVIHRLTGDGPKELLIAPLCTGSKRYVLNQFHAYLKRQEIWQGRSYIHV